MNLVYCTDYEDLSAHASTLVIAEVERKKDLLLCAATGTSPIGLYDTLVRIATENNALFEQLQLMQLDEWGGVPAHDPGSCVHYLKTRLVDPLGISPDRFISFASTGADLSKACERVRSELECRGPIDLCILGLGVNGHVGFNEPGPLLIPHCHVAQLSEESRRHAMIRSMDRKPRFGLTLGMQELLASRKILLLVTGAAKREAVARLLTREVSTMLPASLLWLHGNADCLIDRTAVPTSHNGADLPAYHSR